METVVDTQVVFFYALSRIKGIGRQTLQRLASRFSEADSLFQASQEDLESLLGRNPAHALYDYLHVRPHQWHHSLAQAYEVVLQHLHQAIFPIPLTSQLYPTLLKLIPDPPIILYAKGNTGLLKHIKAVAVVGTREPTQWGLQVAYQLAHELARRNCTIVSGLAKGIDRAAHIGALDAHGKTIAVFGTPLDTIYPAANRDLAERILSESGLFVSELPLGQQGFRQAFVQRDRIQSGFSLAVLPIQTSKDGGTMHTVNFAHLQKRLIACPQPSKGEAAARQYEGIWSLIRERHIPAFNMDSLNYEKLLTKFQVTQQHLLPDLPDEDNMTEKQPDPVETWQVAWESAQTEPSVEALSEKAPSKRLRRRKSSKPPESERIVSNSLLWENRSSNMFLLQNPCQDVSFPEMAHQENAVIDHDQRRREPSQEA